jgi:hypothetical protein
MCGPKWPVLGVSIFVEKLMLPMATATTVIRRVCLMADAAS